MTLMVFYVLKKMEPSYIKRLSKKLALKNVKKYEDIIAEKSINISNESIIIDYKNSNFEMKINQNTHLDIVGKYIMVLNAKESGYKSKLIIPINIFNSEDEKNIFIDKVVKLIN